MAEGITTEKQVSPRATEVILSPEVALIAMHRNIAINQITKIIFNKKLAKKKTHPGFEPRFLLSQGYGNINWSIVFSVAVSPLWPLVPPPVVISLLWLVTPKSVPPKIGPAGLILAEKPAKTGPPDQFLPPKSVRPDQFWQPKLVPP